MKNLKVDFTISTGKQYENVHVSAEVDDLPEARRLGDEAEEQFHDCYKPEKTENKLDTSETEKLNFEK